MALQAGEVRRDSWLESSHTEEFHTQRGKTKKKKKKGQKQSQTAFLKKPCKLKSRTEQSLCCAGPNSETPPGSQQQHMMQAEGPHRSRYRTRCQYRLKKSTKEPQYNGSNGNGSSSFVLYSLILTVPSCTALPMTTRAQVQGCSSSCCCCFQS